MNTEELKKYLSNKYQGNRSFLENVIFPIFGNERFIDGYEDEILETNPEYQTMANATGIRSVKDVGVIYIDGEPLQIFDISVSDRIMMERNRVTIQSLVRRMMDQYSNAFMIFHYEDVSRWDWRFTFCHKSANKEESTDSKRYTFLLGPKQSCRTAADNFVKLYNNRANLTLKNIEDAFSVEALSERFFNEYKGIYADIIFYITGKHMVKKGSKWEEVKEGRACRKILDEFCEFDDPEKAVRDYVKKLMGRLVFLQFLQKKGWLGVPVDKQWGDGDNEFTQHLFEKCDDRNNFVDDVLEKLFNDLNTERKDDVSKIKGLGYKFKVPYLNGGLFECDAADKANFPLPARYMEEMLEFFSRYNFTIDENDPNDAEVGVDPEMLGRIFENLLEDNKDKGAFYTPKEIVSYMCRESLIAYLQTGIEDEATKEAIRQFVTTHDVAVLSTNDRFRQQVDEALKNVKICDPAIGSGAFPMGLLKELFQCRTALEGIDQHQAAEIKKHIIQQNIYGVDIERGAVDIARLRFWLSLIVDEETPQALPNLDFKIMQGNSLLEQYKGVDLSTITELKTEKHGTYQTTMFDDMIDVLRLDLRKMLEEYYDCTDHRKKQSLRAKIIDNVKQQLREQSINVDFEDLDLSGNNQFMLWHTWFYEVLCNGGFDIVIGNPPYIGVKGHKALFDKVREGSLNQYFIGKMDYFYFFFHHTINILREKGIATLITTNYYVTADGAIKLRKHLHSDCSIKELINLGEMKLFENAPGQHNIITLFTKVSSSDDKSECKVIDVHRNGALNERLFADIISAKDDKTSYSIKSQDELFDGDGFYIRLDSNSDNSLENILKKISIGNETIRDICDINQGIVSGADYVSEKHKKTYVIEAQKGDGIFVLSSQNLHDSSIIDSINKSESESKLLKVFFKNSDISKYFTKTESEKIILFIGKDIKSESELSRRYPLIYKHLKDFRTIMIDKRQSLNEKIDQWFTLNRGTSHPEVFQREKIVCPQRSKANTFGYNNTEWYAASDVFYLTNPKSGYSLKYILGLLNSKLYYVWLYNRGKRKGESLELTATPLSEIPVKMADESIQTKVVNLVNKIQNKLKVNPLADITSTCDEIDKLVYQLYGLTFNEVLVVDPTPSFTQEEYESKQLSND